MAENNVGIRGNTKHHRQRQLYPRWSRALKGMDPNYFVVECPLNFDVSPGISVQPAGKENLQNNINSLSRLLVLKNKSTGKIRSAIMYLHFKGMPDTAIAYGNRKTFSGLIYFTTLGGRFINGWMYENGKITRRSSDRPARDTTTTATPLDSLAVMDPIDEDQQCYFYVVRHYERYCSYNTGTGDIVSCTPWQFTYSESFYYCVEFDLPDGGGGGITLSEEKTEIIDQTLSKTEYNYVEEDNSDIGYVPIIYYFHYTVTKNKNTGNIISVVVTPVTANPMLSSYIDKYGRNVNRRLTVFNQNNYYTLLGTTSAMINWSCMVNAKYSYSNGNPVWTRNWNVKKSTIVY